MPNQTTYLNLSVPFLPVYPDVRSIPLTYILMLFPCTYFWNIALVTIFQCIVFSIYWGRCEWWKLGWQFEGNKTNKIHRSCSIVAWIKSNRNKRIMILLIWCMRHLFVRKRGSIKNIPQLSLGKFLADNDWEKFN